MSGPGSGAFGRRTAPDAQQRTLYHSTPATEFERRLQHSTSDNPAVRTAAGAPRAGAKRSAAQRHHGDVSSAELP